MTTYNDHILGIYLTFNMDFIELVKKTRNHVDNSGRKLLENFVKVYKITNSVLEKNIKKAQEVESLNNFTSDIFFEYKNILLYLLKNKLNYHLSTFLRPLQDSYKLFDFLIKKDYIATDLIVLDNPNNLHADSNIIDYFKSSKYLDKNYVGVSKLCCGYCHKYLKEARYEHRGTHGVCDEAWKMNSPLEEKFKDSAIKIQEFDQSNQPVQYRKLSIDILEKEILVDFIDKDKTLWDFKINSGLIKAKVASGIKSYIFYEGKTVQCEYRYVNEHYEAVNILGQESIKHYGTMGYFGVD
jgi:hypothetical protein